MKWVKLKKIGPILIACAYRYLYNFSFLAYFFKPLSCKFASIRSIFLHFLTYFMHTAYILNHRFYRFFVNVLKYLHTICMRVFAITSILTRTEPDIRLGECLVRVIFAGAGYPVNTLIIVCKIFNLGFLRRLLRLCSL